MENYYMCIEKSSANIIPNNLGQKAIFKKSALWTKGRDITIGFNETGSNLIERPVYNGYDRDPIQDIIQSRYCKLSAADIVKKVIIERFQPLVNLNFKFVNYYNGADIRISFNKDDPEHTYSNVGKEALKEKYSLPTMNFAWLDVGTILHEFGHAIGMQHEHQSPNSDIKWNKPKVYAFYSQMSKNSVDSNVFNKFDADTYNSSDFDPLSIMLYFYPPELTLDNIGTRQNERLSGYDVQWIFDTYGKEKTDPNYISPEDFYFKTYGITLAASKAESDRLRLAEPSFAWWKILLIIIAIMAIIAIIAIIITNFYKKNHDYQRVKTDDIPLKPLNRRASPVHRGRGIMGVKRD